MRHVMIRGWMLAALIPVVACSELSNCPEAGPDITIETGTTVATARTYSSAPPWGPRDAFPAKTTLRFVHQLGFSPESMRSYVSFTAEGTNFVENTGNQGEWLCVDDDELVLRNNTCEDFYVFAFAYGSGTLHAPCACKERRDDGSCP